MSEQPSPEALFAEANELEALVDELASSTSRLTDVWVGPSQERIQAEATDQIVELRAAVVELRAEAATLAAAAVNGDL